MAAILSRPQCVKMLWQSGGKRNLLTGLASARPHEKLLQWYWRNHYNDISCDVVEIITVIYRVVLKKSLQWCLLWCWRNHYSYISCDADNRHLLLRPQYHTRSRDQYQLHTINKITHWSLNTFGMCFARVMFNRVLSKEMFLCSNFTNLL